MPGFQALLAVKSIVKIKPFMKVRRVRFLWLMTCSASSFKAPGNSSEPQNFEEDRLKIADPALAGVAQWIENS